MKTLFRYTFSALCLIVFSISTFAQSVQFKTMQTGTNLITTTTSSAQRVVRNYAVGAIVTVNTPAAIVYTCAATDICTTATAHGFVTGLKTQTTTTAADFPAGLAATTDYFVIRLTNTTFSLATSLANAQAGTAIDITDAGTGTHTITPVALAGGAIKLQGSVNCVDFADIADTSTNVTATGNILWNVTNAGYQCVRASTTLTAGMLQAVIVYSESPPSN